ncbi:MAG TPA: hypothetical protein VGP83_06985 [Pyrinomonadaceae bacterium]|jgi:hypothetical protein|nr:hypothetical protein [Pyrinomonadaceae bacterium]
MNTKRRNGSRVIAIFVLFAIAQIGLQVGLAEPNTTTNPTAIPQQFVARLTTRNNQPITVNGLGANTGASILTGATIETGADQSATVNLGPLGQLDIAPNTKLVLTYDEHGNVKALLIYGCAILTAKKKTTGEVATEQGSAGKTDPAAGGVLDICFPQGATAPTVGQGAAASAGAGAGAGAPAGAGAGGGGGLFGLGVPATIAIFTGVGVAVLVPIALQDNPSDATP